MIAWLLRALNVTGQRRLNLLGAPDLLCEAIVHVTHDGKYTCYTNKVMANPPQAVALAAQALIETGMKMAADVGIHVEIKHHGDNGQGPGLGEAAGRGAQGAGSGSAGANGAGGRPAGRAGVRA